MRSLAAEPRSSTSGPAAPRPPALLRPLFDQFARPSGLLGRLAGRLMAKGIEDDEWLTSLLEIKPYDRVLEVGFGPGVAIELIAARAANGLVAGIDPSDVMLREAKRRNRLGVE